MTTERALLRALMVALVLCACQARAQSSATGYSAAGLYNAANAYARAGKPGMAVLNYERARLLAPNDPDIEANLRLISEPLHVPAAPAKVFARVVPQASPTLLAWSIVLGVFTVGVSVLAGAIYPGRYRLVKCIVTAIGVAMIGLTAANGVLLWPKLHEAVVIASNVVVRVSPAPMGDALFALSEAETVKVTAEHEDFVLVETRTGHTGWAARASLAPIVPSE